MNFHEIFIGQYEPKKMTAEQRKDKINTRGTKIGISTPGPKITKADSNYSTRSFKW